MIYVLAFQFHAYLQCLGAQLAKCLNTVLKVKALVGALNQEKALVGAFSVIVHCTTGCGTDGALHSTNTRC